VGIAKSVKKFFTNVASARYIMYGPLPRWRSVGHFTLAEKGMPWPYVSVMNWNVFVVSFLLRRGSVFSIVLETWYLLVVHFKI
jgi:hypothetical protein